MMKTTEKLVMQLMVMEGLMLEAYEDAAGVLTIGYGHTKGVRRGDRLKSSTLLKVIRSGGSKNAIKREFKRWVHAGGKQLKGLERRREWEAKRFFE